MKRPTLGHRMTTHRSILATLLLCVLFLGLPLAPSHAATFASNGGLERLGAFSGAGAPVLQGDRAYVSEAAGIMVLDATTPATPTRRVHIPLNESVSNIVPVGNLLVITFNRPAAFNQWTSHLAIMDVTNLNAPVLHSTIDLPSRARVIAATATTAYLEGDKEILLVDVRDVRHPTLLSTLTMSDNIRAFAVADGYGYVGLNNKTFSIVDTRNPAALTVVGSTTLDGIPNDIEIVNGRAYVTNAFGGFIILDISNPTAPATIGTYTSFGDGMRIAVAGNVAYFSNGVGQLEVVDITNPTTPAKLSVTYIPGMSYSIVVSATAAWVSVRGGFVTVSITDPTNPSILGTYAPPGVPLDLIMQGTTGIAATGFNGLQILNLANPLAPTVIGSTRYVGTATAVAVSGSLAVVGDIDFGLKVVDITDPTVPVVKGSITLGGVSDVTLIGTVAYVATSNGLASVDVQTPSSPQLLQQITHRDTQSLQVAGNLTYTAGSEGLVILNTQNPANPLLQSKTPLPGFVGGLSVVGNRAYITYNINREVDYSPELAIFDVTNPAAPSLLGKIALPVYARELAVIGDLAYVAVGTGVRVIDVSDPTTPRDRGGLTGFNTQRIVEAGSMLYALSDQGALALKPHPEQVAVSTRLSPTTGGTLTSRDGTLTLTVGPATVTGDSVITLTPVLEGVTPPSQGTILRAFSLSGRDATGGVLQSLSQPATLTIQLPNAATRVSQATTAVHLRMWNGQSWQDVPLNVNATTMQATAAVSQLAPYVLTRETAGASQQRVYVPLVITTS